MNNNMDYKIDDETEGNGLKLVGPMVLSFS